MMLRRSSSLVAAAAVVVAVSIVGAEVEVWVSTGEWREWWPDEKKKEQERKQEQERKKEQEMESEQKSQLQEAWNSNSKDASSWHREMKRSLQAGSPPHPSSPLLQDR